MQPGLGARAGQGRSPEKGAQAGFGEVEAVEEATSGAGA